MNSTINCWEFILLSSRITIAALRRAIQSLPSDPPKVDPKVWYCTQKQHWLGWLRYYHGPGAYGRKNQVRRDARFAYNHVVNPYLLSWLVKASGAPAPIVASVNRLCSRHASFMTRSGAIRAVVPWEMIERKLWPLGRKRREAGDVQQRG